MPDFTSFGASPLDPTWGNNGQTPTFTAGPTMLEADGSVLVLAQNPAATGQTISIRRYFRDDAPITQLSVADVRQRRTAAVRFEVNWRDDDAINFDSIQSADLRAVFPDGSSRSVRLESKELLPSGVVRATYRLTSPDGVWDASDNGQYFIRSLDRVVTDSNGVGNRKRFLGGFAVNVPATAQATTAWASAVAVPAGWKAGTKPRGGQWLAEEN